MGYHSGQREQNGAERSSMARFQQKPKFIPVGPDYLLSPMEKIRLFFDRSGSMDSFGMAPTLRRMTKTCQADAKQMPSRCQGATSAKFVSWPSWSRFSWQIQQGRHPASQVALHFGLGEQRFPKNFSACDEYVGWSMSLEDCMWTSSKEAKGLNAV